MPPRDPNLSPIPPGIQSRLGPVDVPDLDQVFPGQRNQQQPVMQERSFPEILKEEEALSRSQDSAFMLEYWNQTDAIINGYHEVVAQGQKFLPKFDVESEKEYEARLTATKFTNIYRDIVESLASKPFEEPVTFVEDETVDARFEELADDIDGAGNNLTMFAAQTFFNGINSALDWIFVDYPTIERASDEPPMTVQQARDQNIRPFWSHIIARNVLEVVSEVISSEEVLTYFRLLEYNNGVKHVRIFYREFATGNVRFYLYRQITDNKNKEYKNFEKIAEGPITINRIPMVPFMTGRRAGRSFKIYPAMRDAADLQIDLYQQESGLKFAKIMTAYPMLAANGVNVEREADGVTPKRLLVGPNRVLISQPDGQGNFGNWGYIEPSGQSLSFLAGEIKETKQDLRELGRQPLTAQSGNLTVITTAVAAGKAGSAVKAWAAGLKDALENAFQLTALWLTLTPEDAPSVNVFDDFDQFLDGGADLDHLRSMRDNGDLSQETLWRESKRRGVLSGEFDPDKERELLLGDLPPEGGTESGEDEDDEEGMNNGE